MHLQKILLGVTLAAPIGPVSIEMIRRGLKSGFWGAFNIRLGGAIGNTLCLLGAYFGLSALQDYQWVFTALGLFGCALLMYMGITTLKKSLKPVTVDLTDHTTGPIRNSLALGFMLAIFNPVAVVFWLSIFAQDLDPNMPIEWVHLFTNMQIIVGVLLWGAFLSSVLEIGKRGLSPRLVQIVTLFSGVLLLYFGLKYGYKNLMPLL